MKRGKPSEGAGKNGVGTEPGLGRCPEEGAFHQTPRWLGPRDTGGGCSHLRLAVCRGRAQKLQRRDPASAPQTAPGGRPTPQSKLRSEEELARGPIAGHSSTGTGTFWELFLQIWSAPKAGLGCRGSTLAMLGEPQ